MIEIENIAKETQETLQLIVEGMTPEPENNTPQEPEPSPVSIYDAISSLCEDIRTFYRDAGDNLIRAKAIRQLTEAYKTLASVQTVADLGPLQLMQGLKDYCANCLDCTRCELNNEICDRLLYDSPEDWDLPGRVEDGKTEG